MIDLFIYICLFLYLYLFIYSSVGIFVSEDEKKKKEKKNFTVITSVLSALSAIVSSLPCVKGKPLVTVWGQILVDRLHDLLTHSNIDIRTVSASTLATFCLICSGGGRIENIPYGSCVPFSFKSYRKKHSPSTLQGDQMNGTLKSADRISVMPHERNVIRVKEEEEEVVDEEGAWLIQACLGRLSSVLSSSFEKKGQTA